MGAYVGLAVGDALGATVEFMTPGEIIANYGIHREIVGGGWLRLKRGQITDDTEMSLALGEAILDTGGKVEAKAAAEAFSAWMSTKPVDIGHTVRRGIVDYRATGRPEVPVNEHSAGNGGVMRALPVALATLGADEGAVWEAALLQARVTHNCPVADSGTGVVVSMVQRALLGASKDDLMALADDLLAQPIYKTSRRRENPSGYIVDTLQAVFQALADTEDFEDCLVDVVNRGGDADTTGAIAGMIAGALYGPEAIPERWSGRLDRWVRTHCLEQAQALIALSPWALRQGGHPPHG